MSEVLKQRIQDAQACLLLIEEAIHNLPATRISIKLKADLLSCVSGGHHFDQWIEHLETRDKNFEILLKLEKEKDCVECGGVKLAFTQARFKEVKSYISITWGIAERITKFIGPILSPNGFAQPLHLATGYVKNDKSKTPILLHGLVNETFGWPIGVSYSIRNHFLHDGGQLEDWFFFDNSTSQSFKINNKAWNFIQEKAREYGASPTNTRASEPWPWKSEDLREIFKICHREMDDALGILLGSACTNLKTKLAYFSGEI